MNKPYVFNRCYAPRRTPGGHHWRMRVIDLDRPWAVETDTVSDFFETHAEAIEFALSTTREPTA